VTPESFKCFGCGEEGHLMHSWPERETQKNSTRRKGIRRAIKQNRCLKKRKMWIRNRGEWKYRGECEGNTGK